MEGEVEELEGSRGSWGQGLGLSTTDCGEVEWWLAGLIGWVTGLVAFNPDGQERGIPTGLAASF